MQSEYRLERALPTAPAAYEPSTYEHGMAPYNGSREGRGGNLLMDYLRILMRRRGVIAALALLGALLGFLIHLGTLPVYRARTSLDIENLNPDYMGMHTVAATGGGTDGAGGEAYLQTQMKLLQSDTLLDHTVKNLLDEPHPDYRRDDLLSTWKRSLHLGQSAPLPYAALVRDAAARIKVKPLGLTRLVEISCDSWNAEFSARFFNTLTSTFR